MARLTQVLVAVALSCALAAAAAHAQQGEYPRRPVTLIVPASAGSSPDVLTRIVAEHLTRLWRQQVLVVNRPGGGGVIATQAMSTAERDGHTLFMPIASTLLIMPETQPRLPLDLQRDLTPIGLIADQPLVFAVHPSLGVNTLAELVAYAHRNPGRVLFGAARGGFPHMAFELFRSRAGIDITFVPSIQARAVQDAVGGTLTMVVENLAALSSAVQAGSLKALAVTAEKRLANFPDLPTVSESLPELGVLEASGWTAMVAPVSIPEPVIRKISQDLQAVLGRADVRQRFEALGSMTRPMSPDETAAFFRKEQELWRPVIRRIEASSR